MRGGSGRTHRASLGAELADRGVEMPAVRVNLVIGGVYAG